MASGLLPSLGIFHRNYYDAFPLADDIMEPYRPFVDQIVYKLHSNKKKKLDKEVKKIFLEMFYANVSFGEQMVQLGTCLTYTTASVAKFFMGICLLCIGDREFLDIYSYFGSTKPPKNWPKIQESIQFF